MEIILGGAYQGKLAFARQRFSLAPQDIWFCTEQDTSPDLSKRAVCGLHLFLLGKVRRGESCTAWAKQALPLLRDKVILCDDISAGIVPLGEDLRLWREETGRTLALLCAEADSVHRLFCGIATQLKG